MVSVEFEASMTNNKYATAHRLESAVPVAFQFHGAETQTNRRTPTMAHAEWHFAAIQQNRAFRGFETTPSGGTDEGLGNGGTNKYRLSATRGCLNLVS